MAAVLSIDECQQILKNPKISHEDFERIVDSFKVHISTYMYKCQLEPSEKEKLSSIFEGIHDLIKRLIDSTKDLNKKLQNLQENYTDLEKKYTQLKKLEDSLLIGEVAASLERELVKHILKGTRVAAKQLTINQIDYALGGMSSRILTLTWRQKEKIKSNWDRLDKKLGLDQSLYLTINSLKYTRNDQAHPETQDIFTKLSDTVSESDIKAVERMMGILKQLADSKT